MNFQDFKKSFYSAVVFFGTTLILSAAYAPFQTINSSEYAGWQSLSSTLFGKVIGNIADHETRISALTASVVPTGAIMAFNFSTCPSGWTEYTLARGRFLRWLDSGSGNDPDCATRTGGCAVGSTQSDEFRSHTHSYSLTNGRLAAYSVWGGGNPFYYEYAWVTWATGNSETRPKNVMVLYCVKN